MSFPWMDSRYTDKAVVCAICGQWISQGEARKYNQQSKVSAHNACVGAQQMGDHRSPDAPGEASPERESREQAIERMHAENVEWQRYQFDAMQLIYDGLKGIKASLVETNMLISVFVEREVKK